VLFCFVSAGELQNGSIGLGIVVVGLAKNDAAFDIKLFDLQCFEIDDFFDLVVGRWSFDYANYHACIGKDVQMASNCFLDTLRERERESQSESQRESVRVSHNIRGRHTMMISTLQSRIGSRLPLTNCGNFLSSPAINNCSNNMHVDGPSVNLVLFVGSSNIAQSLVPFEFRADERVYRPVPTSWT
jgi:hypothetical protein